MKLDPWNQQNSATHRYRTNSPLTYDVYRRSSVIFRVRSANQFHFRYAVSIPRYEGETVVASGVLVSSLAELDPLKPELVADLVALDEKSDSAQSAKALVESYDKYRHQVLRLSQIRGRYSDTLIASLRANGTKTGFADSLRDFAKSCNVDKPPEFTPTSPEKWVELFMPHVPEATAVGDASEALTKLKGQFLTASTPKNGSVETARMSPRLERWFDRNSDSLERLRTEYPIARAELEEQLKAVVRTSILEFDAQVVDSPVEVYLKTDPIARPLATKPPFEKDALLVLRPAKLHPGLTVGAAFDTLAGNSLSTDLPRLTRRRNPGPALALLYSWPLYTTLRSQVPAVSAGLGIESKEPIHMYLGGSLLQGYPWKLGFTAGLSFGYVKSSPIPGRLFTHSLFSVGFFLP